MGLFSGFGGATLRVFIRELRETKQVLKDGIDTYRVTHGLPQLYAEPDPEPVPTGGLPLIGQGDFLTAWLVEELARDFNIKIGPDTDMEQLARDRGWVDEDGKFLMVPSACAGLTAGDEEILSLLSAKVLQG